MWAGSRAASPLPGPGEKRRRARTACGGDWGGRILPTSRKAELDSMSLIVTIEPVKRVRETGKTELCGGVHEDLEPDTKAELRADGTSDAEAGREDRTAGVPCA
jgi:hypothetical protein